MNTDKHFQVNQYANGHLCLGSLGLQLRSRAERYEGAFFKEWFRITRWNYYLSIENMRLANQVIMVLIYHGTESMRSIDLQGCP